MVSLSSLQPSFALRDFTRLFHDWLLAFLFQFLIEKTFHCQCRCRSISAETYGTLFIFSVKLTMAMEMIGFFVRLSSSLLWFQIYRLGASIADTSLPRETDPDLRNSFLNPPTPAIARQCSGAEEILGGSIYDPSYYTSLFEEGQTNVGSPTATQVSLLSYPLP